MGNATKRTSNQIQHKMTNQEKAREISQQWWGCGKQQQITAYEAAIEAMAWKDEQFAKEKKEIDEQWKRLMAESKSIGVDLLQRKEEQYKKEKQQWIDKACERLEEYFAPDGSMVPENIRLWRDLQRIMKGE